jgi:mercuric ion binding protein
MKKLLLASVLFFALSGAAYAETIKAKVNGMVCAFCATGIEKSFTALPEVDHVKVDLEQKLVTINTKQGQTLDDAHVEKVITDAGYTITGIVREKASDPAK